MKRRTFIQLSSLASLSAMMSQAGIAASSSHSTKQRVLVLVELKGGNDGLNTLVPYADKHYIQQRPNLRLRKKQVIDIGGGYGMHPSLKPLHQYWNRQQMAWVHGLGYSQPERSHFRAADIWHTASHGTEYINTGWVARLLEQQIHHELLQGVVIGDELGPLQGKGISSIAMRKPSTFMQQAKLIQEVPQSTDNHALSHIINTQRQLYDARSMVEKCRNIRSLDTFFQSHPFHNDMKSVAQMVVGNTGVSVYKVTLSGFDTHASQPRKHHNLLHYLATGLDAFARAMQHSGHWNDTLVMTYSEFGRRVEENRNKGTDHGAAASHFVLGGKVKGQRFYGEPPSLAYLDHGDLRYTTDFRSIYSTVAQHWFKQKNPWSHHPSLGFVS